MIEQLNQWLGSLSDASGLPVRLGPDASIGLQFQDGIDVSLELDVEADLLHFFCDLVQTPDHLRAGQLERAMQLNLQGAQTRGASLGWDRDRQLIVLQLSFPAALLDADAFFFMLDAFVQAAGDCRAALLEADAIR